MPISRGIPAAAPLRTASIGGTGSVAESMTGWNGMPMPPIRRFMRSPASINSAAGIARSRPASCGGRPSSSSSPVQMARACSMLSACDAPLSIMARANRPLAPGIASSAAMLMLPADSPKTVTLSGSPPKAAILPCTQRRAASWSSKPALGAKSSCRECR
ncbi:hypothetical protein D3C71_1419080 [compost metagenome]